MKNIFYDISPELSAETAVFPGDQAFERTVALDFKKGHNLLLSSIKTSAHIGAHADAPNHYHPNGKAIHEVKLSRYLGLTQVIEVSQKAGRRISWNDLNTKSISAPRVLLKTLSFPNPNKWNSDFKALSPQLVEDFAKHKVMLIGIDTPSVDPEDDKVLECHNAIYKNNISILEGLVLNEVPEGLYQLVALPLKIKDCDSSPVRAVLFNSNFSFKDIFYDSF